MRTFFRRVVAQQEVAQRRRPARQRLGRGTGYRSGRVEEGPRSVTHSDSGLGVRERTECRAQAERPIRGADGVRRTAIREQSGHFATWVG